jgi:hypothetical protein
VSIGIGGAMHVFSMVLIYFQLLCPFVHIRIAIGYVLILYCFVGYWLIVELGLCCFRRI